MYVHRTSGLREYASGELGDQGGPRGGKGSYVWHLNLSWVSLRRKKRERGRKKVFFVLDQHQTTQTEWIKSSDDAEDNSFSLPSS